LIRGNDLAGADRESEIPCGGEGPSVQVPVRLFALAKERAGRGELTIEVPDGSTVGDVKRALVDLIPALGPLVPNLLIAVDAEYASDDQTIAPGLEVAVIPPVSGGSPRVV
jgi:molybdopterin converting factor subunit 1